MKVNALKRTHPSLLTGRPDDTHRSYKKVVLSDISLARTKLLCFALVVEAFSCILLVGLGDQLIVDRSLDLHVKS